MRIEIQTETGPRTVDCEPSWSPGIVVAHVRYGDSGLVSYTPTHVLTGYSLCQGFDTSKQADAFVKKVRDLCDWTLPMDELKADAQARQDAIRLAVAEAVANALAGE